MPETTSGASHSGRWGVGIVAALLAPGTDASPIARVAAGLVVAVIVMAFALVYSIMVAPFRQRDAARRHVTELETKISKADDRDRVIRRLEALRREFLKNEPGFNARLSPATVPRSMTDALVRCLVEAQEELQAISSQSAGEFDDLAKILLENADARRSAVSQLQAEGKRLFDRAIDRLATPL